MTCIDSMQFGNESIKGAQEWADDEGTSLFCLDDTSGEYTALLTDGVDWVRAQAEAARIGSALAGRPLRVIGPAFPLGLVNFGAEGDPFSGSLTNCEMDCDDLDECEDSENKCALGMLEIAKIVQSDRLYIDLHMHYKNVSQAYEALDNMVDTEVNAWGASAEYLPTTKMVLEFGPKGDSEFALDPPQNRDWDDVKTEMNEFFTAGTPSFGTWDNFIKYDDFNPEVRGWEYLQYEDLDYGDGFQMPALIGQIYVDGYSAVCYGPCIQGDEAASTFRIAALRASMIYDDDWICDQSDYFSPMLRYYSTVGDTCAPDVTPGNGDDIETIISWIRSLRIAKTGKGIPATSARRLWRAPGRDRRPNPSAAG